MSDDLIKEVIHPGPQAAAYARYGEYPVDYSTGVPKIDWCGDLVLEKVGSGTRTAKRLRLDGAYVDLTQTTPAPRHFVRDHLGSTRAVVSDLGTVLETDDFYPLGGPLPTTTTIQPEKYQGKEWNTAASFNIYDFGARLYDPGLGRWISQDPIAEEHFLHSQYLFCAGNPMKFVDPEGSDWYRSNDTGLYQFFERNEEIEGYTNIGETISVYKKDEGIYENYFQNALISRTEEAVSALATILSDPALSGQYLGDSSPLSNYSKKSLMTSIIHQGQQNFLNHPVTIFIANNLAGMALGGIFSSAIEAASFVQVKGISTPKSSPVSNVGPIKGYTSHGLMQAIQRNSGKGVHPSAILDAVNHPQKVIYDSARDTFRYIGDKATVILNKTGKIVTTYGKPRNP